MTLEIITKEEFIQHIKESYSASFMQSGQMGELLEKRGCQVTYLASLKNGKPVVSSLVYSLPMTGGLHMEINSGPVVTDESYLETFYNDLKDYAKEKGALELLVKPYQTYQVFDSDGKATSDERTDYLATFSKLAYLHDGLQTGYPGGEPDWHYVKDLSGLTAENLLQSFSKKGKPLVKKANTFGIKLKKLERDQLHLFKEITSATSDRREYTDKSLDYYQDFYDSWGENAEFMVATLNFQEYLEQLQENQKPLSDKIEQLTISHQNNPNSSKYHRMLAEFRHQNEMMEARIEEARDFITKYGEKDVLLAASLFIYSDKEATYLFSGSYPEFNKFYAPALLQEYVMKEAIKRNLTYYNFLGITGIFDGTDGVLRFKQNFNGYIVRKMGTFRYYPHPLKYKAIQWVKQVMGRS